MNTAAALHRTLITTALALALAVAGLVATGSHVGADDEAPFANLDRVEADSFVAAGVAVSQRAFGGGADAAVLATDATFPDALSASALAASENAPVLFTAQDALPSATSAELERVLDAGSTVFLMGGPVAISPDVEQAVADLGFEPVRVAGETRVETAIEAAQRTGVGAGNRVLLARSSGGPTRQDDLSRGWVDSVSCGAYAASAGIPILLTQTSVLTGNTAQALADLGVDEAIICGGELAVSGAVADQLRDRGIGVQRVSGETRVETSIAVAQDLFGYSSASGRDFLLVPGYQGQFGYGLAATPLAGQLDAPILLVGTNEPTDCADTSQPSRAVLCYLATAGNNAAGLIVVGGDELISQAVADAAAAAAGGQPAEPLAAPSGVQASNFEGDDGTRLRVSWGAVSDPDGILAGYNVYVGTDEPTTRQGSTPTVDADTTDYVVTGLEPDTEYTVAVTSLNRFGQESELSSTATGTPVNDVPANVRDFAAVAGDGQVTLTWTANTELDFSHYEIERTTESQLFGCSGWDDVDTVSDREQTSYVDDSLENGTTYCYRIRAVDESGQESDEWSQADPVTPAGTVPVVSLLSPEEDEELHFSAPYEIRWRIDYTGDENLAEFDVRIQRSTDGGSTYDTIFNRAHGTSDAEQTQSWDVSPDEDTDEARIRITVFPPDDSPGDTATSGDFEIIRAPSQVQGSTALVADGPSIEVSWDVSPEVAVDGYEVQRKVVPVTSSTNTQTACQSMLQSWSTVATSQDRTDTDYVDDDVQANSGSTSQTRYCYRIRALRTGPGLSGDWSGTASTTVPETPGPDVAIQRPSQGDTIRTGSTYEIRYEVTTPDGASVDEVELEYCVDYSTGTFGVFPASCDSGWEPITIDGSVTSAGEYTYMWSVPSINQGDGEEGAIRATARNGDSSSDVVSGILFR